MSVVTLGNPLPGNNMKLGHSFTVTQSITSNTLMSPQIFSVLILYIISFIITI